MALHFGFYHSDPTTGVRTYSAEDMSRLLDGIITNGVFGSYGNSFNILAPQDYKPGDMDGTFSVIVGPGKAWYNGTWTMIDEDETLFIDIEEGPIDNDRVDEIILEVNKNTRLNRIFVLQGLPGAGIINPETGIPALPYAPNEDYDQQLDPMGNPIYTDPEEGVYWYPLYYIIVPRGFGSSAATYNPNNLEINKMAFDVVSSPIEHEEISSLYTEWRSSWVEWFQGIKDAWDGWFQNTKDAWGEWLAAKNSSWATWFQETKDGWERWFDDAEKQITMQSDWAETDVYSNAYIKNKPSFEEIVGGVVGGDGYSSEKTYNKGDTCIFNNTIYVAIADSFINVTPPNTEYWEPTSLSAIYNKIPEYSVDGTTLYIDFK